MSRWWVQFREWINQGAENWNQFWFSPAAPHTLAAIRVLGGGMIFYTHLIWSLALVDFLGPHAWIPAELSRELQHDDWSWSFWWYVQSPALIWTFHLMALALFAMLTVGLYTRVVSVLSAIVTLAYCHRLNGSLFGLDQVNAMLAMYLAVGPSGDVYSLDRWLANRRAGGTTLPVIPSISANLSIRLIQIHMCVIYLFGGIGKLRGEMWWDGSAVWFALANYEYQSWDLTWLGRYPAVIAVATHITVFWETFYCVLVWPRWTRPIFLGLAVLVHGGIALALGMPTFGIAMIIGNMAFLDPGGIDAALNAMRRPGQGRQGEGRGREATRGVASKAAERPRRHSA